MSPLSHLFEFGKQQLIKPPLPFFRWIVHAMKYELKIRAGEMAPMDLYQLSPSEVKQLLLDILQPQQQGR